MALTSPDGRFRFVKDAQGAATATAYDTVNGLLVGWNVLDLKGMTSEERQAARMIVDLLKGLQHSHVLGVHSSWETPNPGQEQPRRLLPWQGRGGTGGGSGGREHGGGKLVYLTTPCTTLEVFVQTKVELLRWRVVKRWCRQVLEAISFLHEQPTPIVHRELGLGNVYIDPSTSHLFVGGVKDIVTPMIMPSLHGSRVRPAGTGSGEESSRAGGDLMGGKGGFRSVGGGLGGANAAAREGAKGRGRGGEIPESKRTAGLGDVRACGTLLIEMILILESVKGLVQSCKEEGTGGS